MTKAGKMVLVSIIGIGLFFCAIDSMTKLDGGMWFFRTRNIILVLILILGIILSIVFVITDIVYKKRYKIIPIVISISLIGGFIAGNYLENYFHQQRTRNAHSI